MAFRIACPKGYEPDDAIVTAARKAGGRIQMLRDPVEAATGADVLYTDTWASMGQETEAEKRRRAFAGFTIDQRLLDAAANDAIVLHCLPAHYGEEITYEASRSPGSAIFDQAENRLHAQKAVLALLLR